jgi:anaerobic selenocysteine-containing dehydrogenase
VDEPDDGWSRVQTPNGRIQAAIPELLEELSTLSDAKPGTGDSKFPFVLSAGERRSFTANTIFRSPEWRKKDPEGSLRMNPGDAAALGVGEGGRVRLSTKRGSVEVPVELSEMMQPGHVSLPNGLGLDSTRPDGVQVRTGVAVNELTSVEDRDWLAGTPWHKHVAARIEAIA